MIRIKNKAGSTAPDVLMGKGAIETEKLKTDYANGITEFKINPSIYGDKAVKEKLIKLQDYKCCFCEAKIGHTSYGDVEHFRPKGGWVQNDEAINIPGYYWLAYNWENLLLCCQLCNQRYKRNYFPLITEATRAINHNYSIGAEDPVFIHPVIDNPEHYIEFNENEPRSVNNNIRGNVTIEKLGLGRPLLNEHRKKTLNMAKDIFDLANDIPESQPEIKNKAKNKIRKYLDAAQKDETEYAAMLRCFFRKNPVDF